MLIVSGCFVFLFFRGFVLNLLADRLAGWLGFWRISCVPAFLSGNLLLFLHFLAGYVHFSCVLVFLVFALHFLAGQLVDWLGY